MKAEGRRDAVNIEIDANYAAAGDRHGSEVWRFCKILGNGAYLHLLLLKNMVN